jgi:aspartate aminotransferase-like enzyme
MTTVDDKDASKIRSALKEEYGVNVAGGQDHLKGKIFRINQMGLIEPYESIWVVNAIELILHRMGRLEYAGIASKVYNETYFLTALEKKEI